MEIQINGHPVEFVLEKEKNLKDVVQSISQWARERELIFSEVWADDVRYAVDNVPEKAIDDLKRINCVILSRADLVADSICEATEYCGRLIEYIDKLQKSSEVADGDIEKIVLGLNWLVEVTEKVLELLGISAEAIKYRDKNAVQFFKELRNVGNTLQNTEQDYGTILLERKNDLSDFRDFLRVIFLSNEMRRVIITSIDTPDTVAGMLAQILNDIPGQKQNLENAAASYHAGKDSEGSAGVESFIDFIYRYFRVCYQINPVFNIDPAHVSVGGVPLNEKNAAINELLNQMILCLENNDIIGLTDVLEYELVPALDDIETLCGTIFGMLQSK
jgi:cell division protein ZapA (FtsZ GTPase activity inhibitor)